MKSEIIRISRPESNFSVLLRSVRMSDDGVEIASAQSTGFIWEKYGTWHLISNLHNFTGWDYVRNRALTDTGFTPTHLEIQLTLIVQNEGDGSTLIKRHGIRLALADEEGPKWKHHPAFGTQVDVGSLEICDAPTPAHIAELNAVDLLTQPINHHKEWISFLPSVAKDAYVVGYPHGMSGGGFPIWKRASIATEPGVNIDGLPKLLVDTATRKGMSGSPVIVVRRGITMPNGAFDNETIIGEAMEFLGVYSGRVGEDELGVQLGVVWKATVIEEIIEGSTKGQWPWDAEIDN